MRRVDGQAAGGEGSLQQGPDLIVGCTAVVVANLSHVLPVSEPLARAFTLNGDVGTICQFNARVCIEHRRPDLAHAWQMTALMTAMLKEKNWISIHTYIHIQI